MSSIVFILVLAAALLHATWNAMVKASGDRALSLGLVSLGHVTFGVVLALNSPLPAPESWPFLLASTIIHFYYYYLLYRAYTDGDLSHSYPIARGISPVLIALGALVLAGEALSVQEWGGIIMVTFGILMLSGDAFRGKMPPGLLLTALLTGASIAAYSLSDGLGVRHAGTALSYIGWLFIFEVFVTLFIAFRRADKLMHMGRKQALTGMGGGVISATAYGLVIYANSLSPLGLVSTLRETSVLFGALIGVIVLHERPWRLRLTAAVIVAVGIAIMATA